MEVLPHRHGAGWQKIWVVRGHFRMGIFGLVLESNVPEYVGRESAL